MHTIIVMDDNSMMTTVKQRIVQYSKLCDTVRILIPQIYEGKNISNCDVTMFYKLPISQEKHSIRLLKEPELYKNEYLDYRIPADTWLTQEAGIVEFRLTIADVSIAEDNAVNQYVRKITDGKIKISAIEDWASCIADPMLETIDQRIVQLLATQRELEETYHQINQITKNKENN